MSGVQELAVDILTYLDGRVTGEREEFELMSSLVASGQYNPNILMRKWLSPDMIASPAVTSGSSGDVTDDGLADFDLSAVTWQMPSSAEKAELGQLVRAMGSNRRVSVSGEDDTPVDAVLLDDDGEWV